MLALPYWRLWITIGLLLLAWKFSSNGRDHAIPVMTFDGSHHLNHTDLRLPNSREQIVDIVRNVSSKGQKLRVLGSGHSLLPIAVGEDVTLSMHNFRGLVSIDLRAKQVTVKAGTTLEELYAILDEHGLAMGVSSTIAWQTVAGAIMTATHGDGNQYGNLATLVVSLELVTARGEVMTFHKGDHLFDAVTVSLGLLGVITQITFQAEDAFSVKQVTTVKTLDECIDQLDNIMRSHDYSRLWIDLISSSCLVVSADKVKDTPQPAKDYTWLNFKTHIFEVMQWVMSFFPSMAYQIMPSFLGTRLFFVPEFRVEKSYEIFLVPYYVSPQTHQEVSLRIEDCQKGLQALREFVIQNRIGVNSFIEVRNVKSDDFWLSPNYQRNSCYIAQILYRPNTEIFKQYFFGYFDFISELQPRPHWGKHYNLSSSHLAVIYPKFKEFVQVKKRLDPSGIFTNAFLGRLFK